MINGKGNINFVPRKLTKSRFHPLTKNNYQLNPCYFKHSSIGSFINTLMIALKQHHFEEDLMGEYQS
jgi:hypothetical protein